MKINAVVEECVQLMFLKHEIAGLICFVHIYGTGLKKKQQYETAAKQVIHPESVDRAGAVSNVELFNFIDELKGLHTDLIGTEASWLRWANWIFKQSAHERETLKLKDPPSVKPNLLELFKVARCESDRIHEVRNGIQIGKRLNDAIASVIPKLVDEVDDIIEMFKSGLRRTERVKTQLVSLQQQLASNENLLTGFAESLGPIEDEFSNELLNGIDNVEDIDHQV